MSYGYQECLSGEALSRYQCKLTLISCKECPYKLPAGVWQNDPCKWPDLQWGDVYSYLIDSPGVYTRESMKAYKSLEAHNFFISGWVQTVFHYQAENGAPLVLKADVKPSQRVNDTPHHPWVAVSSNGTVVAAHCDCMAGLSEACSHVAALLFKVEAAVRLGYTKKACTEEPCKWNADFVKKVLPDPISKIKFYKESKVTKARQRKRRNRKFTPATENEKQQLLQSLKECLPKPVVLSTFVDFSTDFHWKKTTTAPPRVPEPLTALYDPEYANYSVDDLHSKCQAIANSLSITYETSKYIYDITTSQSSSLTWFNQRVGRITSSTVHGVLRTSLENPSTSLIQKICDPSPKQLNVPPIVWGREHEDVALKEFQQVMSTSHTNFQVKRAGFLIDLTYPFIGASTDAIATCECHGTFVVEVKCPYKHRANSLQDFLADSDACLTSKNSLKTSHQYYTQVQLQMYVHARPCCYFVVWGEKFLVISNVTRDEAFIDNMLTTCQTQFVNAILPELLTRKISAPTTKAKTTDKLYCICQGPEDGDMIGCDNQHCKFVWFHMDCIKMKRAPKNAWYCPYCKKQ